MNRQQAPEERPLAEVGPFVITMKPSIAHSRAASVERERLAGTHLDRALSQGVEATFWDAVAALATDEKQQRWNIRSLPQSLSMLRHESTREPQTAEKRRQHIDRTFRLLSQDTRALLELCMARIQARDGVTLRVLPPEIVQQYTERDRTMFLEQELSFNRHGIEMHPTDERDGITISSFSNRSLFHPKYWYQVPILLKHVREMFQSHQLIRDEQHKEMVGQDIAFMNTVSSLYTTWEDAPLTNSTPGLLQRALYACRLQTRPVHRETKDDIDARMRVTVHERATELVRTLRQGFRHERFSQIMR